MNRPIYIAALPITHNGRAYEPGDVFDATAPEADVAHLLESAALIPEGVALRAADAPAHPDDADGPAHASAASAAEVPAAQPDVAQIIREELSGPIASLAELARALHAHHEEMVLILADISLNLGVIRTAVGAGVEPGTARLPASSSAEERTARLIEAISQLDRDAAGDWTASGVPAVAALERLSGLTDLTASERDAAWAALQSG